MVRDLRPLVVGRRFEQVRLTHEDVLRGITRRRLATRLRGAVVRGLFRRAKHAVFDLGERFLILQPGMTGNLLVLSGPLKPEARRYAVLQAAMDDGRVLVFRDIRRLGTILLLDQAGWEAYTARLGPEPLDSGFSAAAFRRTLSASRAAIKKVLMDQKHLVGVGNIYANEALFAAGIDPSRPANQVTGDQYRRLYRHTRRILRAAIDAEGTTFRDYRTGTGQPGNFQLQLFVYGREGEPCRVCGTRLVSTHDIDARSTVFCYRCQS